METNKERTRHRAKQLLWLIGVPVIMLVMGLWQWSRVPSTNQIQAQIAEYQATIHELDAMLAKAGPKWASVYVKDKDGRAVPATLVKSRLEGSVRELESSFSGATVGLQPPLALAAILCSLLALGWAGLGLAYQRRMGAQAMQSRELLLAAFLRGKKLLPAYMVVMVVLLFGAAIALMAVELMPLLRQQQHSRNDMKLMLYSVILCAILLFYSIKILIDVIRVAGRPVVSEPLEVMGQTVTRTQTPALWSFVGQVAQRIRAEMPDIIVVGLNEGFFVTEHAVRLVNGTDVPKGRVLYLPLPYMAFMNSSEVAAVIGHELGHFMGEDTAYSQRFTPVYADAIRNLNAVVGTEDGFRSLVTRPATIFGEMFLDSFHRAVRFWSRKRELAADAVGAQVAGAKAVATSLLRITALEPHVAEALRAHWDSAQAVAGGVLGHVRQLVAAKGMVDPSEHMQNRQSHPFDTHPELAVRLEAVGLSIDDELLRRAMDPSGGCLLQEFGLEAETTPAVEAGAQAPAPAANINATLQSELTSVAAASRQAKIQELSTMVREARTVVPVSERPLTRIVLLATFAVIPLVFGGFILMLPVSFTDRLVGLGLLALGLVLVALAVWLLRRIRKPSLVIRPDGLLLFDQPAVLPWSAIDELDFATKGGHLVVDLKLGQQAPAPSLGVSILRGTYIKAKHQVRIILRGLSGKRRKEVAQTMANYWQASRAGAELERMGVAVQQ